MTGNTTAHLALQHTAVLCCAVLFTDPYFPCSHNHHTSPQLDGEAKALYSDAEAKGAISKLKVGGGGRVARL